MTRFPLLIIPIFLFFSCKNNEVSDNSNNISTEDTIDLEETIDTDWEDVIFKAADGLEIAATLYEQDPNFPMIVLCHQAGYNKFEYAGTANKLNDLGYNCLAIDQRSGGPIGIHQNETFNRAMEQGIGVDYLDAIPDIQAAIDYAYERSGKEIILWGSSYSSTLALWEGLRNEKVKAVISFSPGDYFPELGSLTDSLANFEKPFFITSSDNEIEATTALLQRVDLNDNQIQFKPEGIGHHGSRALWPNQLNGEQYWIALEDWLGKIK